jgi:hypothetical protein
MSFSSKIVLFACWAAIAAVSLYWMPVEWLILPSMRLKPSFSPKLFMENMQKYQDVLPSAFIDDVPDIEIGPNGFIAVLRASKRDTEKCKNGSSVINWYNINNEWLNGVISEYGGVLLRGFCFDSPIEFDNFVAIVHPDMKSEVYLGTTPRYPIKGTKFIQSASEAGKIVSIPTHIELSFSKNPPKRIYFYADTINPPPGGHTPLTDFQAVWTDLNPALKSAMLRRGLLYER